MAEKKGSFSENGKKKLRRKKLLTPGGGVFESEPAVSSATFRSDAKTSERAEGISVFESTPLSSYATAKGGDFGDLPKDGITSSVFESEPGVSNATIKAGDEVPVSSERATFESEPAKSIATRRCYSIFSAPTSRQEGGENAVFESTPLDSPANVRYDTTTEVTEQQAVYESVAAESKASHRACDAPSDANVEGGTYHGGGEPSQAHVISGHESEYETDTDDDEETLSNEDEKTIGTEGLKIEFHETDTVETHAKETESAIFDTTTLETMEAPGKDEMDSVGTESAAGA